MDKITVANLALSQVGEQTITSFNDENNKNAEIMRLIFEPVLEQVLRNHNWRCSTFRRNLARLSEDPVFGFKYQYQIPADPKCLKILRFFPLNTLWEREGNKILTDAASCQIQYVGFVNDMNQLDPLLIRYFYLRLALEMAYRQTETGALTQTLEFLVKEAFEEATFADACEGEIMQYDNSDLINSRLIGHKFLDNKTNVK